eukprot:1145490-Pelagomonas_calceolata.AAC.1
MAAAVAANPAQQMVSGIPAPLLAGSLSRLTYKRAVDAAPIGHFKLEVRAHVSMHGIESKDKLPTLCSIQLASGSAAARPCSHAG